MQLQLHDGGNHAVCTRGLDRPPEYQRTRKRADSAWAPGAKPNASRPGLCARRGTTRTRHPRRISEPGRDEGRISGPASLPAGSGTPPCSGTRALCARPRWWLHADGRIQGRAQVGAGDVGDHRVAPTYGSCRSGTRRRATDGTDASRARLGLWPRRCPDRGAGPRRSSRPGGPGLHRRSRGPLPGRRPRAALSSRTRRKACARSAACTVDQCCWPVPSMIRLPASSRGEPRSSPGIPPRRRRMRRWRRSRLRACRARRAPGARSAPSTTPSRARGMRTPR